MTWSFRWCNLLTVMFMIGAWSNEHTGFVAADDPEDFRRVLGESVDNIITPSDTCKQIVAMFGSAISNFTLCSVTNARPIHLCQLCIRKYMRVVETHQAFAATIDEKGNPCKEYFTNLDRIEIVSDAYNYVHNLWERGKCDYCFKQENGSLSTFPTEDAINFDVLYTLTKTCFDENLASESNETCTNCNQTYGDLNRFYMDIADRSGENICLDIVDTMNTTRELWSEVFLCVPNRKPEFWLYIAIGVMSSMPVLFYLLSSRFSVVQEVQVVQPSRLLETVGTGSMSTTTTSGGGGGGGGGGVQEKFNFNQS